MQEFLVGAAEHRSYRLLVDTSTTMRNGLVEQAERVTHAAVRGTGQQHQGVIIACDALHTRNLLQLVPNLYLRNLFEIELQAS